MARKRRQNVAYTPKDINKILIDKGSTLRQLEQHKNKDSRSKFMCIECNSEFESTWNNVREGSGCEVCADRLLNVDKINNRLKSLDKNLVCISIRRWNDATFTCLKCGHTRVAIVSNVLKENRASCPHCAVYGFSTKKPGWFYIAKRTDGLIKFGITNNIEQRLAKHKVNGFEIVYSYKDSGEAVFEMERAWKKFPLRWYSGPKFDGYTESFWPVDATI